MHCNAPLPPGEPVFIIVIIIVIVIVIVIVLLFGWHRRQQPREMFRPVATPRSVDRLPFIGAFAFVHLCIFYLYFCLYFCVFLLMFRLSGDSKVGRQITFYWAAWLQDHSKPWHRRVWNRNIRERNHIQYFIFENLTSWWKYPGIVHIGC